MNQAAVLEVQERRTRGFSGTATQSQSATYIVYGKKMAWKESAWIQLAKPYSIGHSISLVIQRIYQLGLKYKIPGWEEGAVAISEKTVKTAEEFAKALLWLPLPEVVPDRDGEISFEWYRQPYRTLSVSIGEQRQIHYAALIGSHSSYGGPLPFTGEVPARILALIDEVTSV